MSTCAGSMAATQNPLRSAQRRLSSQYISLILIVLTFVLGALARDALDARPPEQNPPVEGTLERKPDGVLYFNDLFPEKGSRLDPSGIQGLVQFLLSHDVSGEFDVYSGSIEQSVALFKYLIDAGVPPSAARVVSREENSDQQVIVRLFRAEG